MHAMREQFFFSQRFLYGILLHYVSQDRPNWRWNSIWIFHCLNSFWKFSLWISFHFNRPKQREILIILQLISNIIFITVIVYQSNICRLSISFLSVGYFLILANIFEFILWSWLHFITWFEEYSPISCPITFSEVEYF